MNDMRAYLPVLISALIGAVVGGLLFLLPAARDRDATPDLSGGPTKEGGPSTPAVLDRLASDAVAAGQALLATGRLKEAQDAYIEALLLASESKEAWAGLVRVRRRLARDDPALLRRQAEAYRGAIARSEETEEHYAAPAMRVLAQASELAAQELEESRSPSTRGGASPIVLPATPKARAAAAPAPTLPSPRPTRRATRRPAPTPRATVRAVTPTARPTQQPTASQRFYLVRAAPIVSPSHAAEVISALSVAGYAVQVSPYEGTPYYVITVGPYGKPVADTIVTFLTSRFPELTVTVRPAS